MGAAMRQYAGETNLFSGSVLFAHHINAQRPTNRPPAKTKSRNKDMKAAYYEKNGPASEVIIVGDLDDPEPAAGEVLVQVATSAPNPSDVKSRAGARGPMAFERIIPHSDGAGRIVAVGEGVNEERIGERVWLWNAAWKRPHGSNATMVALHEEQAVYLPTEASFEAGACLGIPAMTAHRCLFADGPIDGQDILVTGGAGTVGSYAIQMAKLRGARVFTTVSSEEKAEHARKMGADVVLNYRTDDVAAAILDATDGKGVDRIVEVEFGGNLSVTQKRAGAERNGCCLWLHGGPGTETSVLPDDVCRADLADGAGLCPARSRANRCCCGHHRLADQQRIAASGCPYVLAGPDCRSPRLCGGWYQNRYDGDQGRGPIGQRIRHDSCT
jgi:NADPH2:quinone reductase